MKQALLELEILKSDKLRTTILIAVFASLSLMWAIFIIFYPQEYDRIMFKLPAISLPGALAIVACYFIFIRQIISGHIRQQKPLSPVFRYFTAFFEVSIPTVAMLIMSHFQTPVYILLMPPVLVYFIFIILSSLTLNEWICRFAGLVAAIEYVALSQYTLFSTNLEHIDPLLTSWYTFVARGALLFISGIATGFITSQIRKQLGRAFEAQQERERIESIFGQHVSPEVVAKLLSKNANASEYIPVCVMFLDIRNFTHFTEQHEPAVVVGYLNQLFKYMVEIIHDNKGIINKFLGDGFMAVFGAPLSSGNDTANAIQAARQIIERTSEEIEQGNIPNFRLGIGLHFGYAVTGTIGTERRLEYTIMGDVVNSAAHIEQLNKIYNTTALISEDVLKNLSSIQAEFIGNATLKHREAPVKLYKLV
ncbi:guanylate cyclase [Legionella birminghamensis]|uniref:Guanylate cyclase n=1 Tax=Legionella birminghamensis TaxID=28083 RepID=A0A378I9P7_9GAMM|nr:adenylate/guanylate cyclase domain-containing protein [Legionella birminghamensis]KTC75160.1 guanylate cyclase [Legionella birminghamensis]STX31889.1 guanylate cyclase [Legionella birminghamensis]